MTTRDGGRSVEDCHDEAIGRAAELVLEMLVAGADQGEPVWSEWAKGFVYGSRGKYRTWADVPREVQDVELADAYLESVKRLERGGVISGVALQYAKIRASVMAGGARLVASDLTVAAPAPADGWEFDEGLLADGVALVDQAIAGWLAYTASVQHDCVIPPRLVGGG